MKIFSELIIMIIIIIIFQIFPNLLRIRQTPFWIFWSRYTPWSTNHRTRHFLGQGSVHT